MGQIVNSPDGCRRNWSKLTVYPGIRQLQPPTEIKGNVWTLDLHLNNRKEMSKHIPTHKWNHMAAILPESALKPIIWRVWKKLHLQYFTISFHIKFQV